MKCIHPLTLIPLLATLSACQMVTDDELAKRTDTLTDADNDGFTSTEYGGNDCDDNDKAINPAVTDTPYDGVDNDCSGQDLTDVDGDGHDAEVVGGDDCDDNDEAISPAAIDTPYDGVDNDCSGQDVTDVDGDGHDAEVVGGDDCDDANGAINPDGIEVCDSVDNNCNEATDEAESLDATMWYADTDGDTYGDPGAIQMSCSAPDNYVLNADDCDDTSDTAHPGGTEVCGDGLDNDCNDETDEDAAVDAPTWYADWDGDDFGDPDTSRVQCEVPEGYVADNTDCNDAAGSAHPDGTEVCGDGIDNDCNDETDEDAAVDAPTWYADDDGDDFGDPDTSLVRCDAPDGYVANGTDCNDDSEDSYPGGTEVCGDELDNDCNGETDEDAAVDAPTWYADGDGDDFGDPDTSVVRCDAPSGYVTDYADCNDDSEDSYPGGTEVCGDGLDNDCSGEADDAAAIDASTWYADGDGDDFGDPDTSLVRCDAPSGFVMDNTDCNDDSEYSYPDAIEILGDELDSDCNGEPNGFEFSMIPIEELVLQGPVLTRHGTTPAEKIRIAWTTKKCIQDGLIEHNCVVVETRTAEGIFSPFGHRHLASQASVIGPEETGFDFVSNETHWGWARAISGHGARVMELGGHNVSTGSTRTWQINGLEEGTSDWTDLEAGLSSDGDFSAIACSDATTSSPGIVAAQVNLADLSNSSTTWAFEDTIDEPYQVCAWDTGTSYFFLLSMFPSYSWDRWNFNFPIYDALTFVDSSPGFPVLDLEMKRDVGYYGRAYVVDTGFSIGTSELHLDFAEAPAPLLASYAMNLELQPTEIDLALSKDGRVLVCSLTAEGTPMLQLIDPFDSLEPLVADVIPNADLAHVVDCSIAINEGGQALVVYRSENSLYQGFFALL
jgi:hypothetical protein